MRRLQDDELSNDAAFLSRVPAAPRLSSSNIEYGRWVDLPEDLQRDIFGRVSLQDLAHLSCVTKGWSSAANDRALWLRHAVALRCPASVSLPELKKACKRAYLTDANLRAGRVTAQHAVRHGVVVSMCWSPDGGKLATASSDGTARIVDATSGAALAGVRRGSSVNSVCWSPDGCKLAMASYDGTARIVDATSGAELARHGFRVLSVCWSPDGCKLAMASSDGTARIVDATSGAELVRVRHGSSVNSICWSPDGCKLAMASYDGTVRIVDATSGAELARVRHGSSVNSICWSPDGRKLAMASGSDWTACVVDATSGAELAGFKRAIGVNSVCWSPDGCKLAMASYDGTARIVDATSGVELARVRYGVPVRLISWSPDGCKLATASYGKLASATKYRATARITNFEPAQPQVTVRLLAWICRRFRPRSVNGGTGACPSSKIRSCRTPEPAQR